MKVTLINNKLIIDGEGDTVIPKNKVEYAFKISIKDNTMNCGYIKFEGLENMKVEVTNFIFKNQK